MDEQAASEASRLFTLLDAMDWALAIPLSLTLIAVQIRFDVCAKASGTPPGLSLPTSFGDSGSTCSGFAKSVVIGLFP